MPQQPPVIPYATPQKPARSQALVAFLAVALFVAGIATANIPLLWFAENGTGIEDGPNIFVGGLCECFYGGFCLFAVLELWPAARIPTFRRAMTGGFVSGVLFAVLSNFDVFVQFPGLGIITFALFLVFPFLTAGWILRGAGRRAKVLSPQKHEPDESTDSDYSSDPPRGRRRV